MSWTIFISMAYTISNINDEVVYIYSRNKCIWNNRAAYVLWFKKIYKIGNSTSMSSGIRLNVPRCIKKEEKDVLNYIRNWDLVHDNTHSLKIYFLLRGHSGDLTQSGGSFEQRLNNETATSSLINKTIIDMQTIFKYNSNILVVLSMFW